GALVERMSDVAAALALLASPDRHTSVQSGAQRAAATRAPEPAAPPAGRSRAGAVVIDEGDRPADDPGPTPSIGAATRTSQPEVKPRPRPWDSVTSERTGPSPPTPQGKASDENSRARTAAWTNLIAGALERFERDGLPFAVLLVEVLDVEQLRRGLRLAELPRLMRQIESASTRALEAVGARSAATLALE